MGWWGQITEIVNLLWVVSTSTDTRYNTSGICEEIIYFHQWNGGLANYSRYQYGNWNASSSCYVGSNGNVYIRLPNASYYGFAIDFIQHPWYFAVRDITILNATFSNSSSKLIKMTLEEAKVAINNLPFPEVNEGDIAWYGS